MSITISDYMPAYKILEDEISSVRLSQFLYALGETPVGINGEKLLYFAPYRNDTEPKLIVNDHTGLWYDYATGELGRICDLALLTAQDYERGNIPEYIVKTFNRAVDIVSVKQSNIAIPGIENINMIPLSEFMKAIGHEQPMAKNEKFLLYNVRYMANQRMVLIINLETNHWRDLKTGLHGDIYALATMLTGTDNECQLKKYITDKMRESLGDCYIRHAQGRNINNGIVKSKRKFSL